MAQFPNQSCDLIHRYIVIYFLSKKSLLLPTYYVIKGLEGSQDDSYFHWSVPTGLYDLPTNLYTSVVDIIYVCHLVESALKLKEYRKHAVQMRRLHV